MSGYCPDCGNAQRICKEVERNMTIEAHLRATATAMRESGEHLENARPMDHDGIMIANALTAAAMQVTEYVERLERTHERKNGDA